MKKFLLVLSLFSTFSWAREPWIGKQKALILLLEWADKKPVLTQAQVHENMLQGPDSLAQFFLENSNNTFELSGEVRDWKRTTMAWNVARGCNPDWILSQAWDLFSSSVNPSDYDTDNNGKIDHLFVIHSGRIPHDRVGPDCMFGRHNKADQAAVFQSQGVGSIGTALPIGFYIHEAGHNFFMLPDLYANHYHGQYGIGMWGMMGLGAWGTSNTIPREELFAKPAHFEPQSKIVIGWSKAQEIKSTTERVRLNPVEKGAQIVSIPLSGSNYYLEYRSPTGFSKGHKGHGLLLWKGYDIIQADGRDDLNHGNDLGQRPLPPNNENFGDDSDPFPGSMLVHDFLSGKPGFAIKNIRLEQDFLEFDVEMISTPQLLNIDLPFVVEKLPQWDGVERL